MRLQPLHDITVYIFPVPTGEVDLFADRRSAETDIVDEQKATAAGRRVGAIADADIDRLNTGQIHSRQVAKRYRPGLPRCNRQCLRIRVRCDGNLACTVFDCDIECIGRIGLGALEIQL